MRILSLGRQDNLISLWFYARVESAPILTRKCLVLSQCHFMKLHGFYINSTIWVLLPQQLMSQPKMVSFVTERRGLQFTQQTLCFFLLLGWLNALQMAWITLDFILCPLKVKLCLDMLKLWYFMLYRTSW